MFQVSVAASMNRMMRTPIQSRVMRPNLGSRLFELRDRKFNDEYKLLATRYASESLDNWDDPRVGIEKVGFGIAPVNGTLSLNLTLTNGSTIEVANG
jgi:uncharacterized protein